MTKIDEVQPKENQHNQPVTAVVGIHSLFTSPVHRVTEERLALIEGWVYHENNFHGPLFESNKAQKVNIEQSQKPTMMKVRFVLWVLVAQVVLSAPINQVLENGYTVSISPATFSVETSTTVYWTVPTQESGDTIQWHYIDEDGVENYISSYSLSGTSGTFNIAGSTIIPHVGQYIARLYISDGNIVASSNIGTATYDGFSVNVQRSFSVETTATITWNAPSGHSSSDTIRWYIQQNDGTLRYLVTFSVGSTAISGVVVASGNNIPSVGYYVAQYRVYSDSSVAATSPTMGEATYDGYSLAIFPTTFSVETTAVVFWQAPSGHSSSDYIQWYYIDEDGSPSYIVGSSVNSLALSGQVTFSGYSNIPHVGSYTAKYYVYSDSSRAASSNNTGTATYNGYSLQIYPSTFSVGTAATIFWNAPSGHSSSDYIKWYIFVGGTEIYKGTLAVGSNALSGSVKFTGTGLIPKAGQYLAKYFVYSDNTVAAKSLVANATYEGYSLTIPDTFSAESQATVTWQAPSGHSSSDTIEWYRYGDDNTEYFETSQGVGTNALTGTVTFMGQNAIPHAARYRAKYYVNGDSTAAAVSNYGNATYEGYSVTIAPATFNTTATVQWTAPNGHTSGESIKWYSWNGVEKYIASSSVTSALSGFVTFSGSALPVEGTYIAKYFLADGVSIAAVSNNGTYSLF